MWLHSVARRARRSTRANDALAVVQLARERLEHQRLVVAEAHDVDDLRRAAAVLALDHAVVVDLAAAGGVERGLDELGQQLPVLLRHRRDGGRLLGRLVAGEDRRVAGARRERPQLLARVLPTLAAGAGARADALLLHQRLEALLVDAQPALGGELEREVEREAEGVVELERLVGADALGAGVLRACAITSSSIFRPDSSVRLKASSSVRSHMSTVSACSSSSA